MSINLEFLTNQVDATTQVSYPFYFDGANKEEAELKVMFIGNSITIHEPKEEIGWVKKCGMAASDIDHDYVHIVYRYLCNKHPKTSICVFNGGNWEVDFMNKSRLDVILKAAKEYQPDLIIVRIGENYRREYMEQHDPYNGFFPLINGLKETCNNVFMTSLFWRYDNLDLAISRVAKELNVPLIPLTDLGDSRENMAFDQYGETIYSTHPGDLGMQRIADRIINVLKEYNF